MLFALGVAKIFGVMALSCYVAVLWIRTAHAINERHTANYAGNGESKMRTLERMAKTRMRTQKESNVPSVAFSEVANVQHSTTEKSTQLIPLNNNGKSEQVSITFHFDSTFESERSCAIQEIATAKMDWELYGDNVINFAGKKKRKEAVL